MTYEYALTVIRDANLDWQKHPTGGFVAIMNGITIHITSTFLTIAQNFKKIIIYKPIHFRWQKPVLLEQLLDEIVKQAATQCLEHYKDEYQENLKNELLKQLTGLNT
jgi:hypothetical protein